MSKMTANNMPGRNRLAARRHPTPYQIFEMKTNGVYSKARFYELVKVYHPDRGNGKDEALPRHIKMERYRLIVAANHILADPYQTKCI